MRNSSKHFMLAVIVAVMLMPSYAGALLISQDDVTFGIDSITYDDETGLEWLDLTETAGLSYDGISAQLGVGGTYDGWRYVTEGEVNTLMVNAGIPDIGTQSEANAAPSLALLGLVGITDGAPGYYEAYGLIADPGPIIDTHFISVLAWDGQEGGTPIGLAYPTWDIRDDDTGFPGVGSHLVRATNSVPEPATFLLLGSGLVGMVINRKRRGE